MSGDKILEENKVLIARQLSIGRPALVEVIRTCILIVLIVFLLIAWVSAVNKINELKEQVNAVEQGLYRTVKDMENGGKRFIDYFFSLNAATIEYDQFRAIAMMVNEEDRKERLDYLKKHDVIRKVRTARMRTEILWQNVQIKVKKKKSDGIEIEYKTYLKLSEKRVVPIHVILYLEPVDKTDMNTDGVGVKNWRDLAHDPFAEKAQ